MMKPVKPGSQDDMPSPTESGQGILNSAGKWEIAFFDAKPYDQKSFDEVNKAFGFNIKYFKTHLRLDTAILARGSRVVCAFVNDVIDKKVIDVLRQNGTQLIAMRCSGYNNVDLKYIKDKIPVVRVPSYSPHAVAEHAVGLMLSLNRKLHKAYYRTLDRNFSITGFLGFDMAGKTAGVIGTGQIGKVLIKILKGFHMRVLAHDVFHDKHSAREIGFEYVPLDEIYRQSDIISLNCPLTRDTYHMIDKEALLKMKPHVMIINTGRGRLIKTADLIYALKKGRIGSAGLDVYEEESEYFYEDLSDRIIGDDVLARLLTFPNVLITSHLGFFTREALHNIASTTLTNIREFSEGGKLVNAVDLQV